MNRERFGAFIAERRKSAEMTQRELAETLHVTDKAVSKWERGLSYPDVTLLQPLAEALELTVEELMTCCLRQEIAETEETPVHALLDISRDSLRRERRRFWSRLLSILALLLVTGLVISFSAVIAVEQMSVPIFLKETVNGENYLYVELRKEGHLLRLKCGPDVDFSGIAAKGEWAVGDPIYLLKCRWNRRTYQGKVVQCEPTERFSLGGLDEVEQFAPDYGQVFGKYYVMYRPENYYRNPYGEGYLCDYRFWEFDPSDPNISKRLLDIDDCINATTYDWDGDGDNEVVVRTCWPEKPYTVYDSVNGVITKTWPDSVPEEVREKLICIWER